MSDPKTVRYREPGVDPPAGGDVAARVERWGTLATLALLLVVIPAAYGVGVMDVSTVNRLGRFLCYAICAIGIDLIWGYCGILSLCQAMFFCIGGYAIGMHMALHSELNADGVPQVLAIVSSQVSGFRLPAFWEPFRPLGGALVLALLVPGLVAFLFGYFAFRSRVRGVYFSIITQAMVLAFCLVFRRNETLLCGTNGLNAFWSLGGFDLRKPSTQFGLYLITVVTLTLTFLACRYLVATRLGRLMVAVRDNESRLRFAGYQPVTVKTFAFTLAAVIAAVAGLLYTPQQGIITPAAMEPLVSIMMVLWVAVGGRGTLSGAVIGALLVNYTENSLTSLLPKTWPFVQGGLFIAVVLAFPDGLIGALRNRSKRDRGAPATRGDEPAASGLKISPRGVKA
jgi:urea transport system permease protein